MTGHRMDVVAACWVDLATTAGRSGTPSPQHILSCSKDGSVALWDAASGSRAATLQLGNHNLTALALAPAPFECDRGEEEEEEKEKGRAVSVGYLDGSLAKLSVGLGGAEGAYVRELEWTAAFSQEESP